MTCEHAYRFNQVPEELVQKMMRGEYCTLHVDCDRACLALTDPQTVEELRAALEHWRDHSYLSGCSHGE